MNVKSACSCVLVLSLLFGRGHSNSPCPDIFGFFTDGTNEFGIITVQPIETVPSLEIRINYTVPAQLDDYLGRIDAPDDILRKYNTGETVKYRVYFPLKSPRPKVTEIAVNGDKICIGPGHKPIPNQVLSLPSLQLTNSYGAGGGPPAYKRFQHQPQTRPQLSPQTTPRIKPQTMPQPIPQYSVNKHDYASAFADFVKGHAVGQEIKWIHQTVDASNSASLPFVDVSNSPAVRQPSTTPRSTPATTTTTAATTTITTPVYSQPVRKTTRPEYHFSEECGVVAGAGNEITRLISNGLSYERGEIPWLVAIYNTVKKSLTFTCGGTLVSDRHVVTAAHCMQGARVRLSEKDIVVRVGVHDLTDWGDEIAITRTVLVATIHEFFNSSSLKNDLMILTLNQRVWYNDFMRPACLWSGNTAFSHVVGAIGVVAGWGDVEQDEPRMLRVPIVSTKDCRASTPELHKITSYNTLCAGSRDGSGPCTGDSGGGLYLLDGGKWRLRGVVSLALRNGNRASLCNLDEYVVYTDTAQYLPWIRQVLSQKYFD